MNSIPSSAPFLDSSRWAEATETTDVLRTLARGVTRARAFALFFAVCNRPGGRDQLIAMLGAALPETNLHRVELTAHTTDVLAEVCRQTPQPQGPVLVVGLEQAVPSDTPHHPVLATLNLQRPLWPERVAQPVIFWVPQYLLGFLEREAPDFFDWRSDTLAFPDLAEAEVDHLRHYVWTPAVDGSLSLEARQARTQELRLRLEQSPHSDDPVARRAKAGWLRELGNQLAFSGEWEQALTKLEEARDLCEALGDKRSRAFTLGDIARIRADKGEVDAALQLHQERLGIFEALGDLSGKAQTLWSIAEIEIHQKKWQDALEHLSESYAINLKLGRLDGISFVGLSLGQLFCKAGQWDQGLAVLSRSRDGFQKLGQVKMAQQTQALLEQLSKPPLPT